MKIGVSSVQGGRLANPAAIRAAAAAMEQVGYSSIWVRDGALDAVAVLAATAMVTTHIGLGATLDAPHGPRALARSIATLDVLSDGRLTVALDDVDGGW